MSCRRARIKAVASLPARRKTVTTTTTTTNNTDDNINNSSITNTSESPKPFSDNNITQSPQTIIQDKLPTPSPAPEPSILVSEPTLTVPATKTPVILNTATDLINSSENDTIAPSPAVPDVGIRPLAAPILPSAIDALDPEIIPPVPEATAIETEFLDDECNFDPIVPLPVVKNRPKLKPTPRLAIRRNSVQSLLCESEDESKRAKRDETAQPSRLQRNAYPVLSSLVSEGRVRHESVCSTTGDSIQPLGSMTPRYKISRSWKAGGIAGEMARRAAAKRKALEKPSHNALTMYDLIFYNPPNNAISNEIPSTPNTSIKEPKVDDSDDDFDNDDKTEATTPVAVPQVKIGPDGNIVIDEKSLVIETTDTIKSRELLSKTSVIYDNDGESNSKGLYRRVQRTRDWGQQETLRFYRALNTLGTDFSLMLALFPGRTRRDLKVKYKKEERINGSFVDRALMNPLKFDLSELEKQLATEKEETEVAKQQRLQCKKVENQDDKKKKTLRRRSFASQCLGIDESSLPTQSRQKSTPILPVKRPSKVKDESNDGPRQDADPLLQSPQRFLPSDLRSGSLVVFANDNPDEPGKKVYKAYIVNIVDGVTKLNALHMPPEILQNLATKFQVIDLATQS